MVEFKIGELRQSNYFQSNSVSFRKDVSSSESYKFKKKPICKIYLREIKQNLAECRGKFCSVSNKNIFWQCHY